MKIEYHTATKLYTIEVEGENTWQNFRWRDAVQLLKGFFLQHRDAVQLLTISKLLALSTGLPLQIARDGMPAFVRRKPI